MKISLFILVLVFTTSLLFAQEGFKGGLLLGAVASQVDGDRLEGYYKGGAQAGVFVVNKFNKKTGITIEMKYIQKGSSVNHIDSINPQNNRYYKLRLNYVEVPFMFNFYMKKKFMLELGAGFSYLFRAREDTDGNGFMEPTPQFKKFDVPFVFGLCYYPFDKFHIDFRYSYSMLAIRNHPGNQTWYFNRGQYNNLLSFGMYLHF